MGRQERLELRRGPKVYPCSVDVTFYRVGNQCLVGVYSQPLIGLFTTISEPLGTPGARRAMLSCSVRPPIVSFSHPQSGHPSKVKHSRISPQKGTEGGKKGEEKKNQRASCLGLLVTTFTGVFFFYQSAVINLFFATFRANHRSL